MLLGVCACAAPEKMAWPYEPTPTPPLPAVAQGGALEQEPTEPRVKNDAAEPRVVCSATEPASDLSPVPQDKPAVLVLQWPIPATGINSLFGPRKDPIDGRSRYHLGVDLDAEYGTVVRASAAGRVSSATWHAGHGRQIVIQHAGGFQTVYSHLSQTLAIPNTWIRAGDALGRIGNSGRSTGPHLHFEVKRWGEHLDPLDLLGVPVPLD